MLKQANFSVGFIKARLKKGSWELEASSDMFAGWASRENRYFIGVVWNSNLAMVLEDHSSPLT